MSALQSLCGFAALHSLLIYLGECHRSPKPTSYSVKAIFIFCGLLSACVLGGAYLPELKLALPFNFLFGPVLMVGVSALLERPLTKVELIWHGVPSLLAFSFVFFHHFGAPVLDVYFLPVRLLQILSLGSYASVSLVRLLGAGFSRQTSLSNFYIALAFLVLMGAGAALIDVLIQISTAYERLVAGACILILSCFLYRCLIVEGGKKNIYAKVLVPQKEMDGLPQRVLGVFEQGKGFLEPTFSATQLAQDLGISKQALSLVLNQKMNSSYYQIVNKYRVKEALRLLKEKNNFPVSEIGYLVGYNSPTTFYNAFKKEFGDSPRVYLSKLKENDEQSNE